jgi:hypothetical protein
MLPEPTRSISPIPRADPAPEPSGYLHIGHIKAAILNRLLADKYRGKFLLRFDDTNPEKEEDEFEDSFKGDLELLGIGWDKVVHTSDWFDKIQELTRKLVEEGKAYMDDTDQMTVSQAGYASLGGSLGKGVPKHPSDLGYPLSDARTTHGSHPLPQP